MNEKIEKILIQFIKSQKQISSPLLKQKSPSQLKRNYLVVEMSSGSLRVIHENWFVGMGAPLVAIAYIALFVLRLELGLRLILVLILLGNRGQNLNPLDVVFLRNFEIVIVPEVVVHDQMLGHLSSFHELFDFSLFHLQEVELAIVVVAGVS